MEYAFYGGGSVVSGNQSTAGYQYYDYNGSIGSPSYSRVPVAAKIMVGITYILMMCICGIGNVLLCYVIYRFRRMRTTTNLLIGNLALSDFLVAVICAPFNFYFYLFENWPFGGALCVAVGYLKITSLYVSTNSLLAIAVDRYIVITYPLKPRMTRGTTTILLAIIWLISLTATLPAAIHSTVYDLSIDQGTQTMQCSENWSNLKALQAYTLLMIIVEFLCPLGVMCVAYCLIAKTLWFRVIPGGHVTEEQEQAAETSKRKTIRTLIIMVVLFALCWAPYHGFALTRDVIFPSSTFDNFNLYNTLFYVVEAFAMTNSVFNTMIYIVFNANFRKCVMQMKFPRTFNHVIRRGSTKTRSSRPTSNFRMGTYQRSTGGGAIGASPSRSPKPRSLKAIPNNCFSERSYILNRPPSPNQYLPATSNPRLNSLSIPDFSADKLPPHDNPTQILNDASPCQPKANHVIIEGNGKIVITVNNNGTVGNQV